MGADQLHETLKQRILQLNDQDQIEILSNIEVRYALNFCGCSSDSLAIALVI